MNYRILRHPEIEQDLDDITLLIADYAGVDIALQKLAAIEASLTSLSRTPHLGTLRHEIHPNLRTIPTARKGVITFIVDDDTQTVLIVSITYAGADWFGRVTKRFTRS